MQVNLFPSPIQQRSTFKSSQYSEEHRYRPAQQSDLKVAGSRVSSDIHSARRPIHTHSAKPPIRSSQNTIRVPAINGTPSSGQPAATTPPDAPGSTLPT
ncbi:hypothetical protein PGT21_022356 [Puccinia graminis f. sp. tritici]|uniref:Uncharacterized protein n=1 Tax=Puccinia graminis f. sp. tritici TaxID=56615 RepID=A0A5B0P2V9_PUCGR|nr:hypothetical protein PGT21_022356 [Puccinia graminis f. sp. tritici]